MLGFATDAGIDSANRRNKPKLHREQLMFHKLNNLKFRFIVLASLGAPLMLLWIPGYYFYDNLRT